MLDRGASAGWGRSANWEAQLVTTGEQIQGLASLQPQEEKKGEKGGDDHMPGCARPLKLATREEKQTQLPKRTWKEDKKKDEILSNYCSMVMYNSVYVYSMISSLSLPSKSE